MLYLLLDIVLLLVALWLLAKFWLSGPSLTQYDSPQPSMTGERDAPSEEHVNVVATMQAMAAGSPKLGRKEMLLAMRQNMDAMGQGVPVDGEVRPLAIGDLTAEWVLVNGANPNRRLLYLHGGAFTMGSPMSHRAITTEYSRRLGVAVLAIDYRLMPENRRIAGIEDCQTAYRWILENGPDGPGKPECLLVSGDSAGGNLTLMITAWAKEAGLPAVDAAIALSPATDGTFTSPTLRQNLATDTMLGPMFGAALVKTPRWIMLWSSFIGNRLRPTNPLVSPLHADLSGLPPTLLHASTAEMLEGDSVRYFNKAKALGSPVEIGLWPHMLHVWHAFRQLPETVDAFDHIEAFVHRHVPVLAPK